MSGTAHDHDDVAADEHKSSESSVLSESMILEPPYIGSCRSFVEKNGKQPPSGMPLEPYIGCMARKKAYSDGVYPLPGKRKHRAESSYIDAAFRSSSTNEFFMFTGFHYFAVKYDAQSYSQKQAIITKSPLLLVDGFHELLVSTAFCDLGVDAAFGCYGTNEAFLFSMNWCAKIQYDSSNEGRVLVLEATRWFFTPPWDTKFSMGNLDAACESIMPNEAYLFKGSDYALVNYSNQSSVFTVIKEGRITDEFTCLRNTLFESEIGSAFASHKSNHFYFFKDNTYVLIEFDSKAKESRIIAGPEEIVPTNWPCLASYLPYNKRKYPYPIQPKTWKPFFGDGFLMCVPLANGSLERNSSESKRKRKVEDYALDSSGSSSKSMKTVEDQRYMQRRPRYSSHYIDAAFRSIQVNEVFMFTRREYFVVKYDIDSRKVKNVTKAPRLLSDGFKELSDTRFCTHGVDAAFGCYGTDTAFLFSGNWIVKIKYDLDKEGRVVELKDEVEGGMQGLFRFPGLIKDTKLFCQGYLDAACESTVPGEAYLFKGSCYALINYSKLKLIREGRIEEEFTCLRNTVFEIEIRSAFASHTSNQLYLFKDNTYVLIEFDSETRGSHIIAGPEEIVPTNWPCLEGLLPYKKDIGPNEVSLEYSDDPFDDFEAVNRRLFDF